MQSGDASLQVRIGSGADGVRLDRALADALPDVSRERLKALILQGHVTDERHRPATDPSRKAVAGQAFHITLPPPVASGNEAQPIALSIAYEDEHLIVVDKPAGMVVHPAVGNADGTLVNALLHHCRGQLSGIGGVARPGIVHRIDKDTSGLLVAAKSDRAHEGLARQFAAHSIERRYLAIVGGRPNPASGTVDAPVGRSPANRKKMAIVAGGKRAVTHYRLLAPLADAALVECRLETGRTHQVRVHMASIGHALLGDPVYANRKPACREILATLGFQRQALHAAHLGFIHPVTSNALAFDSEMPSDMRTLRDSLMF
ncbi:RluA family pseudouridine synthase [Sphingomonas sp.]|uniref:RluA family pseudouridine synthase n=1 Tax=Sphingomonas sp. TaxID=28214 RepID=UPI001DE651FF|nr:RluA family pseudouridine synthase [Sphingomonas sp.]MBX9796353.1 RluA family pseudouridine synthase [Sphingomonas sp.]